MRRALLHRLSLLLLLPLFVLSSCELYNPDEQIPSYIRIESFELESVDANLHGAITENITDVWVFVNDEQIGGFELPATIPILEQGPVNLKVFAGIKLNGIAASRLAYPFFDVYELGEGQIELVPDSVITIEPITRYNSVHNYLWNEDFENTGLDYAQPGPALLVRSDNTTGNQLYGGKIGRVALNATDSSWRFQTDAFQFPRVETEAFIEMDYAFEAEMVVRVISYVPGSPGQEFDLIFIRPTFDDADNLFWNKIYIDLTPTLNREALADSFRFVFHSLYADTTGLPEQNLYIDNLKLIHE